MSDDERFKSFLYGKIHEVLDKECPGVTFGNIEHAVLLMNNYITPGYYVLVVRFTYALSDGRYCNFECHTTGINSVFSLTGHIWYEDIDEIAEFVLYEFRNEYRKVKKFL